jgi:hypothetical protein
MERYPDKALLRHAHTVAFHHRNWLLRFARRIDCRFRRRSKKPNSKYNVARRILAFLRRSESL